jgi:hypothetical protein
LNPRGCEAPCGQLNDRQRSRSGTDVATTPFCSPWHFLNTKESLNGVIHPAVTPQEGLPHR